MPTITGLYRYPIKGLSAQPLSSCHFEAGLPLSGDRVFALVRPGAPIDPIEPRWAKKGLFAMLMLDEQLASVRTVLDIDTSHFSAARDDVVVAEGNLADPDDREALERFFWSLLPHFPAPPKLVRSKAGHFMDKPDNVVSLINLATVRDLERRWNVDIDPLRFRANIYIDGLEPWAEFDWIGHSVSVGDAVFRVDRRNGRCGATNVDPTSGLRDRDIPGRLRASFGHKDLGVYLVVQQSGTLSPGQDFTSPEVVRTEPAVVGRPQGRRTRLRRFICGGCYHVYDEELALPDKGIPPNTLFEAIPDDWRCPDCGTDKGAYSLVLEGSGEAIADRPGADGSPAAAGAGSEAFVVDDIVAESDEMTSVLLRPDDGRALPEFLPGQHVQVRTMPTDGRAAITRTYSLSGPASPLRNNRYRISVRRLTMLSPDGSVTKGLMSHYLTGELRVGDTVRLKPPAGRFALPLQSDLPIILIAAGSGITPFMSYLEAFPEAPSIVLLYGNRNGRLHAFKKRIEELEQQLSELRVSNFYSDPLPGDEFDHKGRIGSAAVTDEMLEQSPCIFMCGPSALMETVRTNLLQRGVSPLNIHRETFGRSTDVSVKSGSAYDVTFARSAKTVRWTPDKGVLAKLAESSGVYVPSGCRIGECGACAAQIVEGSVSYLTDVVSDNPTECLTCQTYPTSKLIIDL